MRNFFECTEANSFVFGGQDLNQGIFQSLKVSNCCDLSSITPATTTTATAARRVPYWYRHRRSGHYSLSSRREKYADKRRNCEIDTRAGLDITDLVPESRLDEANQN